MGDFHFQPGQRLRYHSLLGVEHVGVYVGPLTKEAVPPLLDFHDACPDCKGHPRTHPWAHMVGAPVVRNEQGFEEIAFGPITDAGDPAGAPTPATPG